MPEARLSLGTAWRFGRICVLFCRGWFELVFLFRGLAVAERAQRVQAWCDGFLRTARVTVQVQGQPPAPGPALLVANHVSWLDMVVLQSLSQSRFIAKSEVGQWPLIGTMATLLGTLYIRRASIRSTADVVRRIARLLQAGERLTVFPEGTTTDGTTMRPFQASLLQGAIDAGAQVHPVAIRYFEPGTLAECSRAAYAGDDALVTSIWRTLSDAVIVRVSFGQALDAGGQSRRALAVELQGRVHALRGEGMG